MPPGTTIPASITDPRSSAAAPCGTGTPARGHFAPEIEAGSDSIDLAVKQDPNRLCYVHGTSAEAPVIRVRQGSDLVVTLRNEITDPAAIGSFVAAGRLDEPNPAVPAQAGFYSVIPGMRHAATGATNLHVHGFAVPPVAPQDEVLNTCVDPAVGPARCGRREFTYRYKIPADMPAGLYWYHPHVHGEVQAQMLMGLAGAIVVEGPADDARRAAGIEDRIFVIRQSQDNDTKATPAASRGLPPPAKQPEPPMPMHDEPAKPVAARADGNAIDTAHELLCSPNAGIDEITLNGSRVLDNPQQDGDLAQLQIPAGGRQLWRILNAATDAFLDIALVDGAGAKLPIEIVARDGAPLTDAAGRPLPLKSTSESQPVPPAGRVEFLVAAPAPGRKAYLVTHAVDTGCAGDGVPERRLAVVTAGGAANSAQSAAPTVETAAAPDLFAGLMAQKTDKVRVIAFAEYPRAGSDDQTDFYIVERKRGAVLRPYEMNDPPAITVKAGTTEEWIVENWTHELHAFHIHQIHFRVLEVDGEKVANPDLLDVVTVPFATAAGFHSRQGPVIPGRGPRQAELSGGAGRRHPLSLPSRRSRG